MQIIPKVHTCSSNEWYTPALYVNAAREVMGGIDLDPASCELANQTVKATRYYTEQDNGLAQEWYGKVYCNPPFTAGISVSIPQLAWGSKLVAEYAAGNVEQAILLIMAASKQVWFHKLWRMHDGLVCFCEKRVMFIRPDKNDRQDLREGLCFIYLGPNQDRFVEHFSSFGTITKRISTPAARLVTHELWTGVNA